MQISLECQKTSQDQDSFPLQKGAYKQHPVTMEFKIISENLLEMH
jgi:hypothetical protein